LARRKKKKKKVWFGFGKKRKRTKAQTRAAKELVYKRFKLIFGIIAVISVFAVLSVGFVCLDQYVKTVSPVAKATGPLQLENTPSWFNSDLDALIKKTAGADVFPLDKETARIVAERLQKVTWLDNIRVRVTSNAVKVEARYRKPVASIEFRGKKFYLDKEASAMKYLPVANLPVVEIKGYSKLLNLSNLQHQEDIRAGLEILLALEKMDAISTPEKPLLAEIATIDVNNFNGRKNKGKTHIILFVKDGIRIDWGSAFGMSTGDTEATDRQKLSTLYSIYKEKNKENPTLLGRYKYIDLQDPQ